MVEDQSSDRQSRLKQQIAASMEELRQLKMKPTLDDFQDFWRRKLEIKVSGLHQELRAIEEEDPSSSSGPTVAVS